jgi:nicotinamide-nucleotide amidase
MTMGGISMRLKNSYKLSIELSDQLIKGKKKLALAESCTGGGLSEILTAIPGASQWFDCAFITYSNEAKIALLGVSSTTLNQYGAVSQETVTQMAKGALKQSHADLSLSISGIAGPGGGSPEKPVGTIWFGLAQQNGTIETSLQQFSGGRQHIRLLSVQFALEFLLKSLS